ncbi:MAG: response regulator [Solobacterium sp.]|nr:response regulator [Solobacterium sp.]
MNLLIVDDDYLDTEGIRMNLAETDLEFSRILTAANVPEAKRVMRKESVEIALVDIEMPGESGLDFTRWLMENGYGTLVIFVTSHARFDYAAEALRLQARDYLLKPVELSALESSLRRAVNYVNTVRPQEKEDTFMDETGVTGRIREYIDLHISEKITRDQLADVVYLHPDYLAKIFKEETGMKITEYILSKKVELACRLLKETDMTVSEVGFAAGFGNTSYFDKIFRRQTGVTPKQFRGEN